jgi:hypothetical protein
VFLYKLLAHPKPLQKILRKRIQLKGMIYSAVTLCLRWTTTIAALVEC